MKRWPLRIILCLILGAITTVAVAWGCAWIHLDDIETDPRIVDFLEPAVDRSARVRQQEVASLGRFGWSPRVSDEYVVYSTVRWDRRSFGCLSQSFEECWDEPPGHLTFWNGAGPQDMPIQLIVSAGWPVRALIGEEWEVYGDNAGPPKLTSEFHRLHAMSTTKTIKIGTYDFDVAVLIPLCPTWPGFVIDTLFYGAIWFGVFFGFTSAKRFLRIKRGRCPRCGYDLRGQRSAVRDQRSDVSGARAGCPECGWNRPKDTP